MAPPEAASPASDDDGDGNGAAAALPPGLARLFASDLFDANMALT
jgi:hypothetical protein